MIAVTRSHKPGILARKEWIWLTALQEAGTEKAKKKAAGRYRHSEIKGALNAMFDKKCAYCESKIAHVSYPHIEHYRPQSKYPDLTFVWDNLLLACGICNSTQFKGDKFPEANEGGPYVNPCLDNPNDHFEFIYDTRAKLTSVYGTTQRGKTTEQDLGLNRADLRSHRSIQITRIAFIATMAPNDPVAQRLLDEARGVDAEYAAFVRTL